MGVGAEVNGTVSTCSYNSAKLLALAGINVAGAGPFEGPKDLWQSAFRQYGDREANAAEPLKPNPNPMFPPIGKVNGLDNAPHVGRASRDYGHDPRDKPALRIDSEKTETSTSNAGEKGLSFREYQSSGF